MLCYVMYCIVLCCTHPRMLRIATVIGHCGTTGNVPEGRSNMGLNSSFVLVHGIFCCFAEAKSVLGLYVLASGAYVAGEIWRILW